MLYQLPQYVGDMVTLIARLDSLRWERWSQGRARARSNIEFHYDHPAAFYRQFLDARMVYSCAYFEDPQWTLEEAQLAKLDLICRKLECISKLGLVSGSTAYRSLSAVEGRQ